MLPERKQKQLNSKLAIWRWGGKPGHDNVQIPKSMRCEKQFWAPPFRHAREIRKSKQQCQSVRVHRLGRPYETWWRSHYPQLRSVVLLAHGVGLVNVQIHITSALWQLAARCLNLGVGVRGRPIRRRHCRGRNCSTRAGVKLDISPTSTSSGCGSRVLADKFRCKRFVLR